MSKNHQKAAENHERFIQEVCESGQIWSLKNPEVYAFSSSLEYRTSEGEAIPVFCCWSKKNFAQDCVQQEWEDYEPVSIPLGEFIERWCTGMDEDGIMIGTNFDKRMQGFESEPLMLILELTTELKRTKNKLELMDFESLNDIEEQIKDVLAFRGMGG